jgi:hypothetical protein
VRNVTVENVQSASSPRVLWIAGFPGATIDNISFSNCTFRGVEASEQVEHAGFHYIQERDHRTGEERAQPQFTAGEAPIKSKVTLQRSRLHRQ